ncbi:serine/threonine-protein kinase [Nocardia crassostreae]|uniref:serine/threonine-protein kinase n=1 Tax=Nocardia crassostreae TaxID=53428 RepID=UPI000A9D523E|nr:serine/threonine-protein kinase [Nocardia crassostreae]
MTDLAPGAEIAGYVIVRRVGSGGSGTVYVARHPRLPRYAAIKVLDPTGVTIDREAWRRFEREADITARFDHPNIVSVYDRGVDGGRLWIAMQFVEGADADGLRGISPDRALRIAGGVASALDYAHGKGVLHRDVKPSNILLSPAGDGRAERALLTDFGIARLRDESTHLTRTGNIAATFAFASPEQISGQPLDPRTDQYSLACTLFVLLTDERPFLATDLFSWIHMHTQVPPRHISEVRPELPGSFDPLFDRALAKQPEQRFAGCTEFVDAVARAWESESGWTTTGPVHPMAGTRARAAPTVPVPPPVGAVGFRSPPVAAPVGHRAPVPARGRGQGPLIAGILFGAAAILLAGAILLVTVKLESGGNPGGTPLTAGVSDAVDTGVQPTGVTTVPTVAPTVAVPPVASGQVPAGFVGTWSGTSSSNNDDYRLIIWQGNLNEVIMTSTVFRGGNLICAIDYRLLGFDSSAVTVGDGVLTAGVSGCVVQGTQILRLSEGTIVRELSVSGRVTYVRVS